MVDFFVIVVSNKCLLVCCCLFAIRLQAGVCCVRQSMTFPLFAKLNKHDDLFTDFVGYIELSNFLW